MRNSREEQYVAEHSSPQSEALEWIQKQTHIRTNYPRMLTGAVQGRFLTMLARISGAERVLEIGTFTGYSSTCFAYGIKEGGMVDTLEINDELEDLIREGWERAGVRDRITLHIGDAKETLRTLSGPYDIVYMDANKREYCDYYDLIFDLVRPGGLILADDVLWDGKLWQDPMPSDKQTLGIAAFNDMVAADSRVESVILPWRDGLNIIRKK
ncbi:MAG: O-methyltransferase [Bacteroidales bacterium]|uniref:O-methyltransferase n=1 Tax=Candidatus Cryptobacteroides sp. TaxID=2952915 RepID=UPI002A6C88CC|nr:O-methyltransferase [Candidatus Cryptobacteroides sp.]MBS7276695.1 class I SAM-dependent methyltransferase [Bacteroidales bacterium]MCI6526648.1 O-methyltransferase [Bacteroidales bacterium]MDD5915383.1 O-methyltransferase [Bacteroidales bacterium]MDD6829796.1 O-methyltransferase [Bacteroidales bacterium]MDD7136091.1 O-methyltransferase [Bacteroidales bacterium]